MGNFYSAGEIDPYLGVGATGKGAEIINKPRVFFEGDEVADILTSSKLKHFKGTDMYLLNDNKYGSFVRRISLTEKGATLHPYPILEGTSFVEGVGGNIVRTPELPAYRMIYTEVPAKDAAKAVNIMREFERQLSTATSITVADGAKSGSKLLGIGLHERANQMIGTHIDSMQEAFKKAGIKNWAAFSKDGELKRLALLVQNAGIKGTEFSSSTWMNSSIYPQDLTPAGHTEQVAKIKPDERSMFYTEESISKIRSDFAQTEKYMTGRSLDEEVNSLSKALKDAANSLRADRGLETATKAGSTIRAAGRAFTSVEEAADMARAAKITRAIKTIK